MDPRPVGDHRDVELELCEIRLAFLTHAPRRHHSIAKQTEHEGPRDLLDVLQF